MSQNYLDRYREKGKSSKPKKIKPKKFQGAGLKIVDADEAFAPKSSSSTTISLSRKDPKRILQHEEDELNTLDPDEMPQVVNMIDDRPVEVQLLEEFRQANKWKAVAADEDDEERSRSKSSKSISKKTVDSDSDVSPPRQRIRHGSDSDYSPPRRKEQGRDQRKRGGSDNDFSPPRRRDHSPKRKSRRDSPPSRGNKQMARQRNNSGSDVSPPRKSRTMGSDSDASPPRRRDHERRRDDRRRSPPRRSKGNKSDSDASPPRMNNRQRVPDKRNVGRRNSDSDHSPVRRRADSPARNKNNLGGRSPEAPQRMTHTLDGKKAGLQTAIALRDELSSYKNQESERFSKMDDSVSGRYAKTKFRDRATGKLRDFDAELQQKQEEDKKLADRKAQYDKWGKGLKQVEEQQDRVNSAMHEMSKPLARYKDDEDLDAHLKSLDRDGDPMLKFLSKKKSKASGSEPSKPKYQGPAPPPNRFSIPPGYRWDGVDRSNGYEKEWFQKINTKKAFQEESYKWSVEDL